MGGGLCPPGPNVELPLPAVGPGIIDVCRRISATFNVFNNVQNSLRHKLNSYTSRGSMREGARPQSQVCPSPTPQTKFSLFNCTWDENSAIICWFYVKNCRFELIPTKFLPLTSCLPFTDGSVPYRRIPIRRIPNRRSQCRSTPLRRHNFPCNYAML